MKGSNLIWITGVFTVIILVTFKLKISNDHQSSKKPISQIQYPVEIIPESPKKPTISNITVKTPSHLTYSEIVVQAEKWEQESPELTEVGFYGKTKKNTDICYIRICNKTEKKDRPKVLITGCIHGNEPLSTACVMAYVGNLLDGYGKNKQITELIESRDIFFVPVISPDSYPHSRYVDGVDPNRDFPGPSRPSHKSTPSVQALQNLFLKIKPNSVISGHTFGQVFLIPFGDTKEICENEDDYQYIANKMAKMCNYKIKRICNLYRRPIHGTETDWYYRNGAFSLVIEFGTHQKIPTRKEIESEYQRTWDSMLFFIKESPIVKIKTSNDDYFDYSGNTGVIDRYAPVFDTKYKEQIISKTTIKNNNEYFDFLNNTNTVDKYPLLLK